MKKIIVTKKLPSFFENLVNESFEVLFFDDVSDATYHEFINKLPEAEGLLITADFDYFEEVLELANNLKGVSTIAVGHDNIPVARLAENDVKCTHTPDVLSEATADLIFGLLLATARRIPELDEFVKSGKWQRSIGEELFGTNVYGKKLGIIGLGSIGQAVAKRAKMGFSMEVYYHNRSINEEAEKNYSVIYKDLNELLTISDYVCITVPLTNETKGLIGLEQLRKMKRKAILINGSRGQVIVERDLVTALEQNIITAAGLDVYESEPANENNPLLKLTNVVTLPHAGSATHETRLEMSEVAISDLHKIVNDIEPKYLIN